ncbi:MAG: tryptophan--tRNA ligase [Candidatus Portnoybacteria bacterium]|nr:tryptophan--tRNA ligase [Candidatus Portnoybacteria bacterium]
MKKRIFSGIRPSGSIHIGNYLGAIKNWVEAQNNYDSIFCIVDLHALTTPYQPKELAKNTLETAAIYLALGLDPKKNTIFIQSHVPEHTEMTWLLNTITKIQELQRMTQFKDKSTEKPSNINAGLLNYPVLMAADILLYNTNVVPVGQDQKQHVELARTLARRFNRLYGKTLTVPNVLIKKEGAKIMRLDDPLKKMAKSATNPYNAIALTDSPTLIKNKIKKAVTDSGKEIEYNPKKPAIANLMTIYHCFSGMSFNEIEKKYKGKGYAQFKEDLTNVIIKGLKPFQEKKKALDKKPDYVNKILQDGAKKAQTIAQKTLKDVKKKMGLS